MGLIKYKLGELIERYDERCEISDLTVNDVSGINRDKEFFEPSRQIGKDTSNYKVVPVNYFATNLMHVGRDIVLPIGFNHSNQNKIVSPAYTVFRTINHNVILSEYLFMYLNSEEKDRYFWFFTDASIRDGLSWEDFCEIEILLPSIDIQKKYVDIYKALLANQEVYEEGLEDLKLSCDATIDEFKNKIGRVTMGELVSEVDVRNKDKIVKSASGVDVEKRIIPSKAKVSKKSLLNYKLIAPGEFVFSGMQTGRDKNIRIALNNTNNYCAVSPAYTVLKIKEEKTIPEYIMLWFSRKELDRYGWFLSDSSIRSNLDLNRFYEIEVPLPDLSIQRSIANIFSIYIERKEINEKLKSRIKTMCPILIKGAMKEASR